ncbi:SpoIIE family protein phosphatase [Actinomadura parmotrematis]|uniref:SpoIIE family protein phosphatase n=1 Tax=Actinomadura parmotrematis TaxID=2864039 RepID=UPI003555F029
MVPGGGAAARRRRARRRRRHGARLGRPPGSVLGRLNELACRNPAGLTASALLARYRPATGELTWAQAGHPPLLTVAGARRAAPARTPCSSRGCSAPG